MSPKNEIFPEYIVTGYNPDKKNNTKLYRFKRYVDDIISSEYPNELLFGENISYLQKKEINSRKCLYGELKPLEQLGIFLLINSPVIKKEIAREIRKIHHEGNHILFLKELEEKFKIKRQVENIIKSRFKFNYKDNPPINTKHHIIPVSRKNQGFNVHNDLNTHYIPIKKHSSWHQVYDNYVPKKSLLEWLKQNGMLLGQNERKTIQDIVKSTNKDFYKPILLQ